MIKAKRPGQADTHQTTQLTAQLQLGGSGGINPPSQRTLLGHSEERERPDPHGLGATPGGHYQAGNMQITTPASEAGSFANPYLGMRDKNAGWRPASGSSSSTSKKSPGRYDYLKKPKPSGTYPYP